MDLNDITVEDFKSQFWRVFPFLNEYDNTKMYNQGSRVYYTPTELFYDCISNGTIGELPTDTDFWTVATGVSIEDYVLDSDIENAFAEAKQNFNQSLWGEDDSIKLGYLYLTAFWLANDIKAAAGGIGGGSSMQVSSRSVGNVSESYAIPPAYLDNPIYAMYSNSPWGLKYLQMMLPRLVGNVAAVRGRTLP